MAPEDIAVGVLTWPCGHCRPEIVRWLLGAGIDPARVRFLNQEGMARAPNDLLAMLLSEDRPWVMVVERDIVPVEMGPWWAADADVVGVWYPTADRDPARTEHKYDPWPFGPAWHRGLWRARREVLAAVPRPWFPTHPRRGCRCRDFAETCRRNGFTVVTAGKADHMECPKQTRTGHASRPCGTASESVGEAIEDLPA